MYLDGKTGELIEWDYTSILPYDDAFNTIELDVIIHSSKGERWIVPAFWRGGQRWSVRFLPKEPGLYSLISSCSDIKNVSLHNITGELRISKGKDTMPSALALSADHTYLVDEEKKPFFWLSDTWWMALSKRLSFPEDFSTLVEKRTSQGFNVIMLVAGLFPDMGSFDQRASNEAGLPWEKDYTRINPSYFDEADKRIAYIVASGLIPCIVGAWGYYLLDMGEKKMQQHWRYIIARWGSYPVIWTLAGEATMPFYLSKDRKEDEKALHKGWTQIGLYVKTIETFGRLVTVHPTEVGRKQLSDETIIDINLIQSGHHGYESVIHTARLLDQELQQPSPMPLLMGESNYEGILRDTHAAVQRLTFWTAILSGSKGYSYGANGIWQVNTYQKAFGATPHGGTWGNTPWEESYLYEGAKQLAYAKIFLSQYTWWKLTPQPECFWPHPDPLDSKAIRVAGIESQWRIHYFYAPYAPEDMIGYQLLHLYKNSNYHAQFWNPRTGEIAESFTLQSDSQGICEMIALPTFEDWIFTIAYIPHSQNTKERVKKRLKERWIQPLKMRIKNLL